MSSRILVVEDDAALARGLKTNLEVEGYRVSVAGDGEEGLRVALIDRPDLILLDVMMPKLSGLDVCKTLREREFKNPILMLTARGEEMDRVVGLEYGADDYIVKPFGLRELLARIQAHLRREQRYAEELTHHEFAGVQLDFERYTATRDGDPLPLSPREFELLRYMIRNRGRTVTREELLDAVWGLSHDSVTRTVDNHVAKLRHKVDDASDPKHIITVHKVGYRFID